MTQTSPQPPEGISPGRWSALQKARQAQSQQFHERVYRPLLEKGAQLKEAGIHPPVSQGLWLPVRDLKVDTSYQRPLQTYRVLKMARDFDLDILGKFTVSKRENGEYFLIDGQHRQAMLRRLGWDDVTVQCDVYEGLSVQQEAHMFRALNGLRANPNALADYRAALQEGDEEVVRLHECLSQLRILVHGIPTQINGQPAGEIRAVSTARTILREYGEEKLREALTVLRDAWPGEKHAFDSDMLAGMTWFLQRFQHHTIDQAHLIARIESTNPERIRRVADQSREIIEGSYERAPATNHQARSVTTVALAYAFYKAYQSRTSKRGGKRLPPWLIVEAEDEEEE